MTTKISPVHISENDRRFAKPQAHLNGSQPEGIHRRLVLRKNGQQFTQNTQEEHPQINQKQQKLNQKALLKNGANINSNDAPSVPTLPHADIFQKIIPKRLTHPEALHDLIKKETQEKPLTSAVSKKGSQEAQENTSITRRRKTSVSAEGKNKKDLKITLGLGQQQVQSQQLKNVASKPTLDFKGSRAKMPSPENNKQAQNTNQTIPDEKTPQNSQENRNLLVEEKKQESIVVKAAAHACIQLIPCEQQNETQADTAIQAKSSPASPVLSIPLIGKKRSYVEQESSSSQDSIPLQQFEIPQKKVKENEYESIQKEQCTAIIEEQIVEEQSPASICSEKQQGDEIHEEYQLMHQKLQHEKQQMEMIEECKTESNECNYSAASEQNNSCKSISTSNNNSDNESEKSEKSWNLSEIRRRKAQKTRHLIHQQLSEIESKREQIIQISSLIEKELSPELLALLKQSARRHTELVFSEKSSLKLLHHTLAENITFIHKKLKI